MVFPLQMVFRMTNCCKDFCLNHGNIENTAGVFLLGDIFQIDCSEILPLLPYHVPRMSTRSQTTFYLNVSQINVHLLSPL